MARKYPKWIDEYTKSIHHAFLRMIPCSWGPLNLMQFCALLNGVFLDRLFKAMKVIKAENISKDKLAQSFSSPSALRGAIMFLSWEYQFCRVKKRKEAKELFNFLIKILQRQAKQDLYAYKSNIIHSPSDINNILDKTHWRKATPDLARELGKLYNSLSSMVYALYRDFFPQDSCDIYGPYQATNKFGPNTILIIKHFSKIRPVELWPGIAKFKYKDVKIFQVYKKVKFRCEVIGMHSVYEGDLINNLVAYDVEIDGEPQNNPKKIKSTSEYIAKIATKQSIVYDKMSKEDLKSLFLKWSCYQFIIFFKLAGMDWHPTKEMKETVKGKRIADRLNINGFPSIKEFTTSPKFEIYWLKDLYQTIEK